jgi:hypothetical protein
MGLGAFLCYFMLLISAKIFHQLLDENVGLLPDWTMHDCFLGGIEYAISLKEHFRFFGGCTS